MSNFEQIGFELFTTLDLRRIKMPEKENLNPQYKDPQKPAQDEKPKYQPNQPVQQKPQVPVGEPKSPQADPEKHDQEKKKQA
ncbi:MAG: hypothetical protein ACXW3Z_12300 [Limisphaerales bacterium]